MLYIAISCSSIPQKVSFGKKENMPEYYKQSYSLIEKNFNRKNDSVYIYLRGSCFKGDEIIINRNDTITLEWKNNSYRSQVRLYPAKKKKIDIKYKNYNFKVKTNIDYFYINLCYYNDTLRVEYYDYPFVDIIK